MCNKSFTSQFLQRGREQDRVAPTDRLAWIGAIIVHQAYPKAS